MPLVFLRRFARRLAGPCIGLTLAATPALAVDGAPLSIAEALQIGERGSSDGNDFIAIAGGAYYSLALRSNGSLVAWGSKPYGSVPAGNDFMEIAGGYWHSLALRGNLSLVAWGVNIYGECNVPAGNDFIAIAGGNGHSLALQGPPRIDTITPESAGAGSNVHCDLTGARFTDVPAAPSMLMVYMNTYGITPTNVTVLSPFHVTCDIWIPGIANRGPWDVVVTNPSGLSYVLPNGFTVTNPPTVTVVRPYSGHKGKKVFIRKLAGADFQPGVPGTVVELRSPIYPAISATKINVISPYIITCSFNLKRAHPGFRSVYVRNPDGGEFTKPVGFKVKR